MASQSSACGSFPSFVLRETVAARVLTEDDIPGASLAGREPSSLTTKDYDSG